jgi:signal transduction histidine kinase
MVWVTDTAGNCTLLNHFQWDNAAAPQTKDHDWLRIIQPEEHDPDGKADLTFECRVPGSGGEDRWILEQARPRFHADGSFAGYIGLCLDITDRKRTEETLRETQEWLSLAQEAAGIGFWNWDMVTNAGTCSDQYFRLYAIEPRSSYNYFDWLEHVHPDDRMSPADWQERFAQGTDVFQREFRCLWPDGSTHWLYSRAKIFRDETGRPLRALGANIDISGFKEAEERRNQAEKELIASREQLRQLTAHVECAREQERIRIAREIHDELGQILTVLKMDLEAVEARYRASTPRPIRDITRRVTSMLKNLDLMINTVRRISSELRPGILDHLGLAAAIEWQLQDTEARTGIRCRAIGLPEQLPLDDRQSTAVFRIFQEMVTNVVRHAGAATIKVLMQMEAGRLMLQVSDDGCGFDPFRLGDPDALGLLGMRERALLLRGCVQLESQPGKGTTVTLQIPIPAPQQAAGSN